MNHIYYTVMLDNKSALVAQLVERGTSTAMNTRLACVAVLCDAEVYGSNPYGSMCLIDDYFIRGPQLLSSVTFLKFCPLSITVCFGDISWIQHPKRRTEVDDFRPSYASGCNLRTCLTRAVTPPIWLEQSCDEMKWHLHCMADEEKGVGRGGSTGYRGDLGLQSTVF